MFVSKTFSRHVFKTSSRNVLKTSSRRLKCNNFSSSRRLARCLQDVFARRLQDVSEDEKLLRWRRVEDVFKTSWRAINVCWVAILFEISYQELGIKGKARNPGIVAKLSILDVDEGSGYAFEILNSTWKYNPGNTWKFSGQVRSENISWSHWVNYELT